MRQETSAAILWGAVAPLSVVDTTICMGASISSLHGMEKAKGKDYIKNWVAVIGDSTFFTYRREFTYEYDVQ